MKLPSVQVLRGLAALLVVLYHLASLEQRNILANASAEAALIGGLFENGFAGVDLFFVISGFIMIYVTQTASSGPASAARFVFARTTRIYPLWWACSLIVIAYMLVMHGTHFDSAPWLQETGGIAPGQFLWKSLLLVPQTAYPIPSVGWTLIHELYFYLVFAIMLAIIPRTAWPLVLVVWGFVVIFGASMGLSAPIAGNAAEIALHPMTLEFIFGAIVGLLITASIHWRPGIVTIIAALWLTVALCLHGIVGSATLLWTRVLWFGIPSALLIYGVASLDVQRRTAWLLPAGAGAATTMALFQAYGLGVEDALSAKLGPAIVATICGALGALIILWAGWLAGRAMPEVLEKLRAPLNRLHHRLATLGEWSYSLYLVHIIVLSALAVVFQRLGNMPGLAPYFRLGHAGPIDNVLFSTLGFALALMAAKITYTFVEQPSIRLFGYLRGRLFDKRPAPALAE